jgi:hypothetical protein
MNTLGLLKDFSNFIATTNSYRSTFIPSKLLLHHFLNIYLLQNQMQCYFEYVKDYFAT